MNIETIVFFSVYVVIFVLLIITFRYLYRTYKAGDDLEKSIYLLVIVAVVIPILLFLCDKYNIPSKLKYTENVNIDNWMNFIGTYTSGLVSALISAAFLIFITIKQINQTYKDNIELNNENQRLQNLPLLRYNFTHDKIENEPFQENQKWIFSNQSDTNNGSIVFTMEIENIGLNAVRKVYLELESELFDKKEYLELCNQSSIEKNEIKTQRFVIANVEKGTYKVKMVVYYQDLMKNWYSQKVHLVISHTEIYNQKTDFNVFISIRVDDEEMMTKDSPLINEIKNKVDKY